MTTTRREKQHAATRTEILDMARRQMAAQGTAAVALRAIAREMGLSAPALYRYFASRDDLITALIVDAFGSLAAALAGARDTLPRHAHADRFLAVAAAYRDWATAHPTDYELIFGAPIPGYHAPAELTGPAANRSFEVIAGLIALALEAGKLEPPSESADPAADLARELGRWADQWGYAAPIPALHLALAAWGHLHGLVTLELFQQVPPAVGRELYYSEVHGLLKRWKVRNGRPSRES